MCGFPGRLLRVIVSRKTHVSVRIFDANGLEWRRLVWLDTETGEAEQLVLDDQGSYRYSPIENRPLSTLVRLATPVLIMPGD